MSLLFGPFSALAHRLIMNDTAKTMDILVRTERTADRILQIKQELVMLDKRRQETREALRELGKMAPADNGAGDASKAASAKAGAAWVTIGSMLVKLPHAKAVELLKKDQVHIEAEINKLRSDQKVLVVELRDLEHQDPLRGHDLQPLHSSEIGAIRANLPGF